MASQEVLLFKKLSPYARAPQKGSEGSAGFDLFSSESVTLAAMANCSVKTDISFQIPLGTYGRIAGRSGMTLRGLICPGGVIDNDFTGNVRSVCYKAAVSSYITIQSSSYGVIHLTGWSFTTSRRRRITSKSAIE